MTWDVTMEPLVDVKKTEEKGGHFVGCGAAFPLPKEGCEIVSVGEDSTFADIKGLGQSFEMKETTRKLQIRIRDSS